VCQKLFKVNYGRNKLDSLFVLLGLLYSAVVAVRVKVPKTICCTVAVITPVNSI